MLRSLKAQRCFLTVSSRIRLCPVDSTERVMRRVDRIQLEGAISRVDKVVPGSRGNDDGGGMTVDPRPTVQFEAATAGQSHAAVTFQTDKLVGIG